MEPGNDVVFSGERVKLTRQQQTKRLLFLCVLGAVVGGAFFGWLYWNQEPLPAEVEEVSEMPFGYVEPMDPAKAAQIRNEVLDLVTEHKQNTVTFNLVPDADAVIKISAPSESSVSDKTDYTAARSVLSPNLVANAKFDRIDNFLFDDQMPFSMVLAEYPQRELLYQIQDEVWYLMHLLNVRYKQPAFHQRVTGVELLTHIPTSPFDSTVALTYPPARAVNGFLTAEIMSMVDPANAVDYRALGAAYAKRGMAYGEYGQNDLLAAESLVVQYFEQLKQTADYETIYGTYKNR